MSKKYPAGPASPGEWFIIWLMFAIPPVATFTLMMPKLFWVWVGCSLLVPAVIVLFVCAMIGLEKWLDPGSNEDNMDIVNITWSSKHTSIIRELVSDDVGQGNSTFFKYKKGWDSKRLIREHDRLEEQADKIFWERLRRDE